MTQGQVRKLTDTTGQFLWQPSLQMGQPDRLLGYEVFTWENLGNYSTANAYPVVFGDFRRAYTLVTRTGLQVVRENVTAPGFTKFYMARRYGGILTNNEAIKVAKVALS
jgi:HK97 family phage major capsid protein